MLLVSIHTLHFIEMAIVRRMPLLTFALNPRTFFFSLMEALAGLGWLHFWDRGDHATGAAILLIGLTMEHLIQGGQLKPAPPGHPTRATAL